MYIRCDNLGIIFSLSTFLLSSSFLHLPADACCVQVTMAGTADTHISTHNPALKASQSKSIYSRMRMCREEACEVTCVRSRLSTCWEEERQRTMHRGYVEAEIPSLKGWPRNEKAPQAWYLRESRETMCGEWHAAWHSCGAGCGGGAG